MIVGLGMDLVRISRIQRLVQRFPQRISGKIYTPDELASCRTRPDYCSCLAGRFAVKEAVLKTLGVGWAGGARFADIEVLSGDNGRPLLQLRGKTADLARAQRIDEWHISISHDHELAIAVAVAECSAGQSGGASL